MRRRRMEFFYCGVNLVKHEDYYSSKDGSSPGFSVFNRRDAESAENKSLKHSLRLFPPCGSIKKEEPTPLFFSQHTAFSI
jgi:hypothetical protein